MKLALLSDADSPGLYTHRPRNWEINSVEALAWALGGEVWHGTEVDDTLLAHLNTYDVILINLKISLIDSVPMLASRLTRPLVAGFQEDASDFAGLLNADELTRYLEAFRSVKLLFVYDPSALDWFREISHVRCSYLPLPAPLGVYSRFRKPFRNRPPLQVSVGPAMTARRGTYLSIAVASALGGSVVCAAGEEHERRMTSRLIVAAGGIPNVHCWVPWKDIPNRHERSWLSRVADCSLAVNLDMRACYGRMVVDCAGLWVPCVGSDRIVMQRLLYPSLMCRGYGEIARAHLLAADLAGDPDESERIAREAYSILERELSVESVRRHFQEGITSCDSA